MELEQSGTRGNPVQPPNESFVRYPSSVDRKTVATSRWIIGPWVWFRPRSNCFLFRVNRLARTWVIVKLSKCTLLYLVEHTVNAVCSTDEKREVEALNSPRPHSHEKIFLLWKSLWTVCARFTSTQASLGEASMYSRGWRMFIHYFLSNRF